MKIKLRALEMSDRETLAELINNKKIWDNLKDYIPYPYQVEDADNFINLTKKESPGTTFAIVNDSNELIGVIGLVTQTDIYRFAAELGYWIGEPFWGKGVATKAIRLITDYGFEKLKLERIYAGVFEFNRASMIALEKNGFELESILKNAIVKNEKVLNEHMFVKLK